MGRLYTNSKVFHGGEFEQLKAFLEPIPCGFGRTFVHLRFPHKQTFEV